jgi:nucleoside 2-deoxyribosyltransferase
MSEKITAVVSGSFKYKPEIDKTIDVLEQTGISVLEPTKGWLTLPKLEVTERLAHGQIRPLPTEERLTTREIEDRFLRALARASLVYIRNDERYMGLSTAMELGSALARNKPTYALEPLDFDTMEIYDLEERKWIADFITVLPPELVADHYRENL